MFVIHRSNRAENLVERLGDVLAERPAAPFEPETVVVQGRGMERWLSMELAQRFGVWANPSFPFPRHYLLDLFARCLAVEEDALQRFEPESLTWAIAARLPGLLDRPAFAPLARYLKAQEGPGRLLAVSERIARTFDDYVVFRFEMIEAWQRRCDGTWQSILWRRLVEDLGENHVAARSRQLSERLADGAVGALPERISIFGVSTLAPLYLRIFAAIGRIADVHLFALSPSREYWADLRSRRSVVRDWIERGSEQDDELEEVLELEEGNRLLSSLGRIGREFQAVLEATVDYAEEASYEDPAEAAARPTMLEVLQSDMLNLVHRAKRSQHRPFDFDHGDESIAVHSCHSPMREVQVLHDQLLAVFAGDATLRPQDVIVMTPDIDAYAPFVEAVFDGGERRQGLPYQIADRVDAGASDLLAAFGEVLKVLGGRMSAAEVVDLLRLESIRRRFGFADEDVEIVREWVEGVAVRWGIDASHRREHGHPEIDQNTWAFGLRRLLLGYAMGDDEDAVFADTAPYPDVEGSDAEVLGRLAEFCDKLFTAARRLRQPRAIGLWPAAVDELVDEMLWQEGTAAHEAQAIRNALASIVDRARMGGYGAAVDLASMSDLLDRELRARSPARGFLSGAVTFCALVPMRSIPFKVVCLIGMNDGGFPRVERRPDFDHIGQKRKWGDRSIRDDDRYMVLEALLSARQRLYLSFVGQSAHAQTMTPPSVVVEELLDALADSFAVPGDDKTVKELLIHRHPLQAFSPLYFQEQGGDLVSYSRDAFAGARALVGETREPAPFLSVATDWSAAEGVEVADFARFFENPARAFLQRRLSVYLGGDVAAVETREPVELDALERWQVADRLLRRALTDRPCDFRSVARLGVLPAGALGRVAHEELYVTVRRIAAAAEHASSPSAPVEVDLSFAGDRLVGVLRDVGEQGLTHYQYSRVGGPQELTLWIRHLVLCAVCPDRPWRSRLVGRKGSRDAAAVDFEAVADARAVLSAMLALYRSGMGHPLPLFAAASRVYAQAIADGKRREAAAYDAERAFADERGDLRDEYVCQLYAGRSPFSRRDPLGESAAEVAIAVYGRFLAVRTEAPL